MSDKKMTLLYLVLLSLTATSSYASDNLNGSYQQEKSEVIKNSQKSTALNLDIDSDIIDETTEQQNTVSGNNQQLLPNLIKDQKAEKDISLKGGILMEGENIRPEDMSGAEISIKVKTK